MKPRPRRKTTFTPRRRVCLFCTQKIDVDWKDVENLSKFLSDRGKILSRQRNGACAKHQRRVTVAIKRARHVALLPFVAKI